MTKYTELKGAISSAQSEYASAVSRRSGVTVAKERLRSLLESNIDVIKCMADEITKLHEQLADKQEEIDALNAAIAEVDKENRELKKSAAKKVKSNGVV